MDPINPTYYQSRGIESIQVIEAFCADKPYRWAPLKYLFRAGKKPGQDEIQDLRKAIWWIEREIATIEQRRASAQKTWKPWSLEQQTELEARVALVAGRARPTCPELDQEYDRYHTPVVDGGRFDVV